MLRCKRLQAPRAPNPLPAANARNTVPPCATQVTEVRNQPIFSLDDVNKIKEEANASSLNQRICGYEELLR